MKKVISTSFDSTMPLIGYFSRKIKNGKEYDMIKESIDHIIDIFFSMSKNNIAVFIEPALGSGYPDIVIVEYYENRLKELDEGIERLRNDELTLLFELSQRKTMSISNFAKLLGHTIEKTTKSLNKLEKLNLVKFLKNSVCINRESPYFCIKKIIAIEAKIDKWNAAIEQANYNNQFSTESYIMINKDSCSDIVRDKCDKLGLGIITVNGCVKIAKFADKRKYPVSSTSMMFCEWIIRKERISMENINNDIERIV